MLNSINSQQDCYRLGDFQNSILAWGSYINLIEGGDKLKQILKIAEELEEYTDAILSGDIFENFKKPQNPPKY